jgi:glycerol kinase
MAVVIAIDAGTTGVRALAVDAKGEVVALSYRELTQFFPRPGWVEHDAAEIFRLVEETLAEVIHELQVKHAAVAAVGITNQRETAVAWDKRTGQPVCRAIVWQDRRTAQRCRELEEAGHLEVVRARTGLVLDSYFSATKWEWMLTTGAVEPAVALAFGTVDDWLCWKLTGRHATDATNASRTLCYDIVERAWSEPLGEVVACSGRIGTISPGIAGGLLEGVPLSAMAGDQQAALFGHQCVVAGQAKVTYGTGSFLLMNLGKDLPAPADGLLSTIAWQIGDDVTYALEGSVFASGATIQWLRDGLAIIGDSAEIGPLAASIPSSEGVFLVPAFTGLGSPWWDPDARATVTGITKGVGRAHLARAAVEAMAYQTRDVVDAMCEGAGRQVTELRADGGASVMDLLLQLQADQCQVPVSRSSTAEVTALGAALLAGLAEGVWDAADLSSMLGVEARFDPGISKARADADHRQWLRAVGKSRG